jgi:hypothetical protein
VLAHELEGVLERRRLGLIRLFGRGVPTHTAMVPGRFTVTRVSTVPTLLRTYRNNRTVP